MSDFPVKEEDKVNSMAIVVVGLATTAILWASVIALQAYFEDTEGEIAEQRATIGRADGVRDLKSQQSADLSKTTYADPNKGTLKRLSIEHAKSAVVRDAKAGAATLIPTLGLLNTATVPAMAGKPALVPADASPSTPAPAAPPADVPAPPGAAPAPGAAPTPGAAPVPAPAEAAPVVPAPAEAAPAAPAPTGTTP